jgi:hypothetical protein
LLVNLVGIAQRTAEHVRWRVSKAVTEKFIQAFLNKTQLLFGILVPDVYHKIKQESGCF